MAVTAPLVAGFSVAAAAGVALNVGMFRQHEAARRLPRLSVARPVRSLVALFSDPRWLRG